MFKSNKTTMQIMLEKLSVSLPIPIYLILKNMTFKIRKIDISLRKSGRFIKIHSKSEKLEWITHRPRLHLYSLGLMKRGQDIGKSYLLDNIHFSNGDLIVDCGSNMGDLQLYFIGKSISIEYFGIEPNPIDFECLQANLKFPGKVINAGLWDKNSFLDFYVDSESASSSLIQPPKFSELIKVKTFRLDSLQIPQKIRLLKLEGEGAEPEIVMGTKGLFKTIDYISVDVGPERGIEQAETRLDVLQILRTDFEIVLENPYHRKTILFKNKNLGTF